MSDMVKLILFLGGLLAVGFYGGANLTTCNTPTTHQLEGTIIQLREELDKSKKLIEQYRKLSLNSS